MSHYEFAFADWRPLSGNPRGSQWDQKALETCKYKGKIYCLNDYVNYVEGLARGAVKG